MGNRNISNLLLVGLLFLVQYAHAHMGMDMSTPSPYGSICTNILGTNYKFPNWDCTTSYRKAMCFCDDSDYVNSVVACISQYIDMEVAGSNHSKMANHAKLYAYNTFLSTCSNLTVSDLQSYEDKIADLPTYYGGDSGKPAGEWPVKSAFKLKEDDLRVALKAYTVYNSHPQANVRYSSALVAYWGAVIAIKMFMHFFAKLFPLAPLILGNTKIGRFIRGYFQIKSYKFTLNTLSQILVIVGFVILTVLLTFCDMHDYNPNYNFQYSTCATYGYLLGMRTGVYLMYMMPLFFIFAGRNNFLQYLTGWSQEPFLVFHRWIARVQVALVLVHALGYTAQRVVVHYYRIMWSQGYWNWGIVPLAFGGFILVQGTRYLRKINYEVFVALHIISAVIYVVGVWWHLKLLEEAALMKGLYAAIAVWAFDRAARIGRILYSGPKKCRITLEGNMLVLTLDKPKFWPVGIAPGTYVFVHFLLPLQFWQSHPLTLTSRCMDPTKIKLYFRVYKGISKTLANKLEKSGEDSLEMSILLDGPYGFSHDLLEYDECLYIVAGSGITVPLAYIQNSLLRAPYRKFQKTTVCWAVSDATSLSTFQEELTFLQKEAEVNVQVYVSPKDSDAVLEKLDVDTEVSEGGSYSVYPTRLNVDRIVQNKISDIHGNLSVMCCGPGGFHVATRNAVADHMNETNYYVQYFEEAYTW